MKTAYIFHPDCLLHVLDDGHPDTPDRLRAIDLHLTQAGIMPHLSRISAPLVTRHQLERVHTRDYLDMVEYASPKSGLVHISWDSVMCPDTYQAAMRAAGAATLAVDLVLLGEVGNAFCAVRPSGHHAESGMGMGFCIFNNVAVAAAHALAEFGLKKVAILDFDVHHGNGTEEIFRKDERVLFCSTFESPLYPLCGEKSGSHRIINVPLPADTDGGMFRHAVITRWIPAIESFQPELIFVSAGFDAHRDDFMAHFLLTEGDYAWVTAEIMKLANKYAQGRVVSILEGGYSPDALGTCVAAHVSELAGLNVTAPAATKPQHVITRELVDLLRQNFALDWHGIHGIAHWGRVRRNGLKLAAQTGARTDVVELFAFLHDSCRLTDGADPEHGKRAAEFTRALNGSFFLLDPSGMELLCHAIQEHASGLSASNVTVRTCWDADRLELSRLNILPDPAGEIALLEYDIETIDMSGI